MIALHEWTIATDKETLRRKKLKIQYCDNNCGKLSQKGSVFCKQCQAAVMIKNQEILGVGKIMRHEKGEVCGTRYKLERYF
jgi:hypothetical protein